MRLAFLFCLLCTASLSAQPRQLDFLRTPSDSLPNTLPPELEWQLQPDSLPKPAFDIAFNESQRKSPALAAIFSFVLPGMGELYAGRFDWGQYSLGAEAALVAGIIGTNLYAGSLVNDYKTLARTNAGVNGEKGEQFYIDASNYLSSTAFNQEKLNDRNYNAVYGQSDSWNWSSDAARRQYRDIRINSEVTYRATYYIIAAMGINRIFSAINAVRFVNQHNEPYPMPEESRMQWGAQPLYGGTGLLPDGLSLSLKKTF